MKKVLVAVLAIAMFACFAHAQDVTSVNVVGFNKVTVPAGKLVLATVNFESFGSADVDDLIGTQLPNSSMVYIWDRLGKKYVTITRTKAGWSPSGTNLIYRGDGFWLKNAGATDIDVTFLGEVPAEYNNSATTTVAIAGVDAVGYAYPTDVIWTNTTLAQSMANSDMIYTWDVDNQKYVTYTKTKAGWTPSVDGLVMQAGRAFWAKTGVPLDWTEVAPYDL